MKTSLRILLLALLLSALSMLTGAWAEESVYTLLENDTYELTKFVNDAECGSFVYINGEHKGKAVTRIGDEAFRGNAELTTVSLPESVTELGNGAFAECTSLTVVAGGSLTTVGNSAFSGCTALTTLPDFTNVTDMGMGSTFEKCSSLLEFVLPQGVTKVSTTMFSECTALASVTLHENVTEIGSAAFARCIALTTLYIPESVTTLQPFAFYDCPLLTLVIEEGSEAQNYCEANQQRYRINGAGDVITPGEPTATPVPTAVPTPEPTFVPTLEPTPEIIFNYKLLSDGTVEITHITGKLSGKLVIPAEVDGYRVSRVGGAMLAYNQYAADITEVVLPDGLLSIGPEAFSTTGITSIDIPDSVTTIEESAFYSCSSLTSVKLPKNLTAIADFVFEQSALVSIDIPTGVTSIGRDSFAFCNSLTSVTLPEGLLSIGEHAFVYCNALTGIRLPDSLQAIGEEAFYDCSCLTEITFPEGLQTIGSRAFTYSGIRSLYIPGTISYTDESPFIDCYYLQNVTLGDGITHIMDNMFSGCMDLDYISIPDSVISIGSNAFRSCRFSQIDLPENLQFIGDATFYECRSLDELTLPKNLQSIGNSTFYECYSLREINLPENLQSIGNSAFYECYSLREINLPENLQSIGRNAFSDCEFLTTLHIPAGVTEIGEDAFAEWTTLYVYRNSRAHTYALENELNYEVIDDEPTPVPTLEPTPVPTPEPTAAPVSFSFTYTVNDDNTATITGCEDEISGGIEIPAVIDGYTVTAIGSRAFEWAEITGVVIPEGVTEIGYGAFAWCGSLNSVSLPSTLQIVDDLAFNCCSMPQINLPEGLTVIGSNAFSGNANLTILHIPAGVTSIGDNAVYECYSLETVTIAEGNTAYKIVNDVIYSTDGSTLLLALPTMTATEYTVPEGVTKVAGSAFERYHGLLSISLPESLKTIGSSAFFGCGSLKNISIPSCTSIGGNAFEGCSSLKQIVLPKGITTIDWACFASCSNLETVVLPESVTYIDGIAFCCCESLTSINLPSAIEYIDESAFEESPNVVAAVESGSYAEEWCEKHNVEHRPNACKHSLTADVIEMPTCIENGSIIVRCTNGCGLEEAVSIPAPGYHCSSAPKVYYSQTRPNNTVAYVSIDQIVPCCDYTEHNLCGGFEAVVMLSDGTEYTYTAKCTTELLFMHEATESHDNQGDDFEALMPTCTKDGLMKFTCAACGTMVEEVLFAQGHASEGTVDGMFVQSNLITLQPPTCQSEGRAIFNCVFCDAYVETILPTLEHSWKAVEAIVPTDFTDGATEGTVCHDCGEILSGCEPIPSLCVIENGTLIKYNGTTAHLVIPESVTAIGRNAFSDCESLTTLLIPAGVTEIGEDAFAEWTTLHVYRNSRAHTYALENELAYEVINIGNLSAVSVHTQPGDQFRLEVISDQEEQISDLIWTSSNPEFVDVDASGLVTVHKATGIENRVVITALSADGRFCDTCTVFSDAYSKLILPAALKQIESNAFESNVKVQLIDLRGCSDISIAQSAFLMCDSMLTVYLPEDADIAASAFSGCEPVLFCASEAQADYAQENDFHYVMIP